MSFFFNNAKKDGATLAVANGGSPPPTPVSVSASTGADDPSDASATAVDLNGSADGAPNGSPFMINEANGKPPGSGSSPGRGQTTKGRPMMQGQGQHQQQQQAATAEEGEAGGDLWSSILKGASTHRATPVKNVLILGDSNSGKSTLLQALRYPVDPLHPQSLPDLITSDDPDRSSVELALSYSYVDVMEDDNSQNDEPAARIGLYELASDPPYPHLQPDDPNMERDLEMHRRAADAAFAPLIRFAITPTSLADSCVVICLDWSKPWTFLRSLERYLGMLQREIMKVVETVGPPGAGAAAAAAASAKAGTAGAGANGQRRGSTFSRFYDLREKLIQFVRDYKEPDPNATASTASNAAGGAPASGVAKGPDLSAAAASYNQHNLTQPLGPGVLCNNVAIPVIVVCSKSDTTGQLEREREFTDDMFDFIQQSLRTLCLKCE
ncbi:hypothetical protein HK101_008545 [Irineochytrium annulatum]|nr:hypothetical protein HK101_008545 [Irineochytrium annulatum]